MAADEAKAQRAGPKPYMGEQYLSYHDESYLPRTVHLRGVAGAGKVECEALTPLGAVIATRLPHRYFGTADESVPAVTDERERMRRDGPLQVLRRVLEVAEQASLHVLALCPYELAHVFDDLQPDLECLFEFQLVEMDFLPTRSLPWDALPPTSPAPQLTLEKDTSPDFAAAFARAHEHLAAGDVFEIVLSRRFALGCADPGGLFRYLGERTGQLRAPYRFALEFPRTRVVGASPELLVRVCAGKVLSRPISGSLRRNGRADGGGGTDLHGNGGTLSSEERAAFEELLASEKEKSELDMLIDLARHDLHRVCDDVRVSDYREALVLETVAHTQATVSGTLRTGRDALDAFYSCLNAGTLVGAPKRKAMEILADIEGEPRNYYGGNLVHVRPGGDLRATILIRTCVLEKNRATVQAGATVLFESDERYEYWECGAKARNLLATLGLDELCFGASTEGEPSIVQQRRVPEDEKRRFFSKSYAQLAEADSAHARTRAMDSGGMTGMTGMDGVATVGARKPRLLLVDNEDSFTFNLEALFSSRGCDITVLRNRVTMPDLARFDGIVLSPGPSAPADAGFLLEYVKQAAGKVPVFGVCLGFQAMVEALGGKLGRLAHPLHGKVRAVRRVPSKADTPLLAGLPEEFSVARYHSLFASTMPAELTVVADDENGVPMALTGPDGWPAFYGVQFHPESFLTGRPGVQLVSNWLAKVREGMK